MTDLAEIDELALPVTPRNRAYLPASWREPLAIVGAVIAVGWLVIAIFAPLIAPDNPLSQAFPPSQPPSIHHYFGTDELGRDVLSRIIYGARISLTVGIAAVAVTLAIGVTIGLSSGFFGGVIDFLLMRFTDVMLTLPGLLLAMALVTVLRPSLLTILLVIGLVSWTQVARVVRA